MENKTDLERVQKTAVKIIFNEKFTSYTQGLARLGIDTLESRRDTLYLNFEKNAKKNSKLSHMFPKNDNTHKMETRKKEKYVVQFANTGRIKKNHL